MAVVLPAHIPTLTGEEAIRFVEKSKKPWPVEVTAQEIEIYKHFMKQQEKQHDVNN